MLSILILLCSFSLQMPEAVREFENSEGMTFVDPVVNDIDTLPVYSATEVCLSDEEFKWKHVQSTICYRPPVINGTSMEHPCLRFQQNIFRTSAIESNSERSFFFPIAKL